MRVIVTTTVSHETSTSASSLDISSYFDKVPEGLSQKLEVIDVPKYPPITRKQFEESLTYWPTQFHETKKIERALTGTLFTTEEMAYMEQIMIVYF